jgi:hypothetical protein
LWVLFTLYLQTNKLCGRGKIVPSGKQKLIEYYFILYCVFDFVIAG